MADGEKRSGTQADFNLLSPPPPPPNCFSKSHSCGVGNFFFFSLNHHPNNHCNEAWIDCTSEYIVLKGTDFRVVTVVFKK